MSQSGFSPWSNHAYLVEAVFKIMSIVKCLILISNIKVFKNIFFQLRGAVLRASASRSEDSGFHSYQCHGLFFLEEEIYYNYFTRIGCKMGVHGNCSMQVFEHSKEQPYCILPGGVEKVQDCSLVHQVDNMSSALSMLIQTGKTKQMLYIVF